MRTAILLLIGLYHLYEFIQALITGKISGAIFRLGMLNRDEKPIGFWMIAIGYLGFAIALLTIVFVFEVLPWLRGS